MWGGRAEKGTSILKLQTWLERWLSLEWSGRSVKASWLVARELEGLFQGAASGGVWKGLACYCASESGAEVVEDGRFTLQIQFPLFHLSVVPSPVISYSSATVNRTVSELYRCRTPPSECPLLYMPLIQRVLPRSTLQLTHQTNLHSSSSPSSLHSP